MGGSAAPYRSARRRISQCSRRKPPAFFVFLGITPEGQDPTKAAPNHSPNFFVDEGALVVGARTMASLAVNDPATPSGK